MTEPVTLTVGDDGVAVLAMNDPEGRNAFSHAFIEALLHKFAAVAEDERARVCVLRGMTDVFCSGAHPDLLIALVEGGFAPSDIVLTKVLLDLPIPTVAAMEGHGVGGGLLVGIACDVVLMAKESRYGANFMNMGFTPGMGTTRLLQRTVGDHIAHEMMFGGQVFKGAHFEGRTGINYVLPRDQVFDKAMKVARRIAEKPRFALELLKRNLMIPWRQDFEATRTAESAMHTICFAAPETQALIRDNFPEKFGGTK